MNLFKHKKTINFIEEIEAFKPTSYFTEIDGHYVSQSLKYSKTEAKAIYDKIVKLKGKISSRNILEETEVDHE